MKLVPLPLNAKITRNQEKKREHRQKWMRYLTQVKGKNDLYLVKPWCPTHLSFEVILLGTTLFGTFAVRRLPYLIHREPVTFKALKNAPIFLKKRPSMHQISQFLYLKNTACYAIKGSILLYYAQDYTSEDSNVSQERARRDLISKLSK